MSIKIMSQVWESDLPPTERFVMLCLADHADDMAQSCYPSVSRLCKRTGFKQRAVQNAIKSLTEKGYLTVKKNAGQGNANVYVIDATPALNAPPQEMHPRIKCTPPPHLMPITPALNAPKPSRTVKEPSEVNRARAIIAEVIGEDLAGEFLKSRKALRKPLTTEHAAKLFVAELAKCSDPIAATNKAILKGWQTVYPEKTHGKPSKQAERLNAFVSGARGSS